MTALQLTTAHRAARNAASLALADTGAQASRINIYSAQDGTLLAVRMLAKPCGTVQESDGRILLMQAADDDLVTATGGASYAEWCDASGAAIASGDVTDADGNYTDGTGASVANPNGVGAFVVAGAKGTQLYAGDIVRLTTALIG